MRLGILREIVNMALDSLRTHKLRSFLTLLGIVIGVMTVIGMVSIIQGLNRSFLSELESIGSDIIIVEKFEPGIQVGRLSEEERQRKDFIFEDGETSEKVPFCNRELEARDLADLVAMCYDKSGNLRTAKFLDDLKNLGFEYATRAGISICIDDMMIPKNI